MKNWIVLIISAAMLVSTGCASKKYVREQTGPIIERVNELDELTAENTNTIRDVDARAQRGIQQVQTKAEAADQRAVTAGQQAQQAQQLASTAAGRVNELQSTVVNLDNYRPVVESIVHFGFDQDHLTDKAKAALDQLAAEIPNTPHYILEVHGSTDSVGDRVYNYDLSKRRASSVIQYLASQHNVPAHKIYVIGLGKDNPAAPNTSVAGRRKNRRVEVRLLTNRAVEGSTAAQAGPPSE